MKNRTLNNTVAINGQVQAVREGAYPVSVAAGRVETLLVQLRTISMNFWASLEHQLRYKKDLSEEEAAAVAAELADLADAAADLDARMQALRNYLDDGEK